MRQIMHMKEHGTELKRWKMTTTFGKHFGNKRQNEWHAWQNQPKLRTHWENEQIAARIF